MAPALRFPTRPEPKPQAPIPERSATTMWELSLITTTDVPVEPLWAVVADVPNWPAWQSGVESVRTSAGGQTVLIRRGGRLAREAIEEVRPPTRLVLVAHLFLARLRTTYELTRRAGGTRVSVTAHLLGPLRFAYQKSVGERLDRDLSSSVRRLVETARVAVPTATGGPVCTEPLAAPRPGGRRH